MQFDKYHGAGNDFVLFDQRAQQTIARTDHEWVARLCDRHFGIGADGLILLQNHPDYDFEMVYFNADGRKSSMCGNGGRCIAAFARHLGMVGEHCRFLAVDGPHEARLVRNIGRDGLWVELKMRDVQNIEKQGDAFVLDTGSPHFVRFTDNLAGLDMVREGREIRYAERFRSEGINVNLVAPAPDGGLSIRTYERGVENETLACGTGVTAAALAHFRQMGSPAGTVEIPVHALGGDLAVRFTAHNDGSFTDVWLCGPAQRVFSGVWPDA